MSKVLYTATVLDHICQFHLPHMEELKKQGYEVHAAAKDNLIGRGTLELKHTDRFVEVPFERSPFKFKNIQAYYMLKRLIDQENYDLIVCNTPVGGVLTRLAARKARKNGPKVVYIAHGFHFYKGAPRKNWMLYYPIEKFLAPLCDKLVTIVDEDYQFAKKHFQTEVIHIHGIGVDPERFHVIPALKRNEVRRREGLAENDFILLCTGELNENKNQETLIKAVEKCSKIIPNLKVLFAGNGPLKEYLHQLVKDKGLDDKIRFL